MKMRGMTISASGELVFVELFGPASFAERDQYSRVFRTGAMIFDAISASALDAYRDLLALYAQRYGRDIWVFNSRRTSGLASNTWGE